MAKTRHIMKRIAAVRNIRTITKAMQAVASAQFKVAHDRIASFGPFAAELVSTAADVVARSRGQAMEHPLLRVPADVRHEVLLVLASERGLCGSYNRAAGDLAIQRVGQLRDAGYTVELHVAGRRGVRYLRFRGLEIARVYEEFDGVAEFPAVAALAEAMMADFLAGRISGLEVAYTQFVPSGRQRPAVVPVLPLEDLPAPAEAKSPALVPYDFMPSPEEIVRKLLPVTVRMKLYQCFLDAAAAEQFTRRAAMQAATDNADDMIRDLRLRANRQRKGQITRELAEITSGRSG